MCDGNVIMSNPNSFVYVVTYMVTWLPCPSIINKCWLLRLTSLGTNLLRKDKIFKQESCCYNPTLKKYEDDTHTSKMGTWESSWIPENSEFHCRGQNTLSWSVFYTVEKVLKWKCRKWPRMSHSNIYSKSYGRKKGQESNWQFDSRPLKIRNRPDPSVCRSSVTHRWKALHESYKFALDFIPIRGLNKELWTPKVLGV